MDRMTGTPRPGNRDGAPGAGRQRSAQRQAGAGRRSAPCWKRCWNPATASAWRATTRSRPTSWPARWPRSIPARVHGLHMVQSVLALPEHLDLFEQRHRGEARLLPSPARRARGSRSWWRPASIEIGAIHTYLELFARLLRRPDAAVALVRGAGGRPRRQPLHRPQHRGHAGDRRGDRVQRRHRDRAGQRDRRQRKLPRVDIPGDWVDFVVQSADGRTTSSRCSPATRRRSPRSRC